MGSDSFSILLQLLRCGERLHSSIGTHTSELSVFQWQMGRRQVSQRSCRTARVPRICQVDCRTAGTITQGFRQGGCLPTDTEMRDQNLAVGVRTECRELSRYSQTFCCMHQTHRHTGWFLVHCRVNGTLERRMSSDLHGTLPVSYQPGRLLLPFTSIWTAGNYLDMYRLIALRIKRSIYRPISRPLPVGRYDKRDGMP